MSKITKEEVKRLSDPDQIRMEVAECFGWSWYAFMRHPGRDDDNAYAFSDSIYDFLPSPQPERTWKKLDQKPEELPYKKWEYVCELPNWTGELSACNKLIDAIVNSDGSITIQRDQTGTNVHIHFSHPVEVFDRKTEIAICKAFLLWHLDTGLPLNIQ